MKALVKRYAEPGLWMEEVPMPQVGVNDVLIKVTKAAICGTDLHMYKWDEWSQSHCTPPYIMGHEFVGVAVEVGWHRFKYSSSDITTSGYWKLFWKIGNMDFAWNNNLHVFRISNESCY